MPSVIAPSRSIHVSTDGEPSDVDTEQPVNPRARAAENPAVTPIITSFSPEAAAPIETADGDQLVPSLAVNTGEPAVVQVIVIGGNAPIERRLRRILGIF
jgi:hypothetical protein